MRQERCFSSGRAASIVCSLCCTLFVFSGGYAQNGWTIPVVISRDSISERHPTFANYRFNYGIMQPAEEALAFVRNNRNICVRRTRNNATEWSDTLFCVPNDSAAYANPTITYTKVPGTQRWMLILAWESDEYPMPGAILMFTTWDNGVWNQQSPITLDFAGDRNPHLAPHDSGAGIVWERRGRIMYSRYAAGVWSWPEYVTPAGDSLNSNPKLTYDNARPVVVWTKRKTPDTTYAIYCSTKLGSAWRQPDTLVYSGDNRQPSFFKPQTPWSTLAVCWSRAYGTYRVAVSRELSFVNDSLRLGGIETLSPYQAQGVNSSPAVNNTPIPITTQSTPLTWNIASTWQTDSPTLGNGIAVSSWAGVVTSTFSPPALTTYHNPDISPGVWSYPYVRFWVAWEGVANNVWKLYGSVLSVMITEVQEHEEKPTTYGLYQNYPNPFNPSTTIGFQITEYGFVSLKVYDLLGREVATLVNEVMEAGRYERVFNAEGVASGIYFYRLQVGHLTNSRKMILLQ